MLNYNRDGSALWPAVFHHVKSLHSLAIHTPPLDHSHIWTPESVTAISAGLPHLTHLEIVLPLEEAAYRFL